MSKPEMLDKTPMTIAQVREALKKIRKRAVNQVERELISHVLIRTGWNRSKASRILKVSYKTLLQKIEELKIEPPPELA